MASNLSLRKVDRIILKLIECYCLPLDSLFSCSSCNKTSATFSPVSLYDTWYEAFTICSTDIEKDLSKINYLEKEINFPETNQSLIPQQSYHFVHYIK